ncbi:uncharacterized protein DS421_20g704670 [Arachis hypogaea]|nr:uncharacterized protein DS421_20g704670 [Arachis hypogaea]
MVSPRGVKRRSNSKACVSSVLCLTQLPDGEEVMTSKGATTREEVTTGEDAKTVKMTVTVTD